MLMMALLPPGGLLGGYAADPGGVNGSWEEACTCVSNPIRVRVALAAGEFAHRLPQRLFLACPRPASMACALPLLRLSNLRLSRNSSRSLGLQEFRRLTSCSVTPRGRAAGASVHAESLIQ